MKKKEEKIAVVIYNYIQYLSIMPGIKGLIKNGYDVDFYCGEVKDDSGFNNLFSDVAKVIKHDGFKVYKKPQKIKYKIVLEPYRGLFDLDTKYLIRYRYGPISAKPNKVLLPEKMIWYDCIICSGPYEARMLKSFAETEMVADLKFLDFKKRKVREKGDKKVLLYLPTYGDESSIDLILDELKKLKDEYYIIAKIHHGTSFLKEESERTTKLKDVVDQCYDLHTELKGLLEISDVVLSDNSASIFEAMLNNIPVAIFSDDINQNKIGELNTVQYDLYKEKILPYTNDVKKISKVLKEALSEKVIKAQKDWAKENFTYSKDPVKDFVEVIDKYYYDNIDMQNYLFRRLIQNYIKEKDKYIDHMWEAWRYQESLLNEYREGKLYKLASKIYKMKNGGK